jgi:crotonobetainyl-CoA:carnitine CoA-transferase CaiB-like acyl-CoA transferase
LYRPDPDWHGGLVVAVQGGNMLEPYRVVDLTDERGNLAAFMLAGLGADVVLVEPPDGSGGRRRGPFAGAGEDPERSLTFWGWNRGKRSVVLDPTSGPGRSALADLCRDADVVIESGAIPVDLAALRAAHPGLVTVSISAFGPTGPKAHWPSTDLTAHAAGCQLAMTGDEDRAPVRTTIPQAFLHASADAAVGALMALTERTASGRGQHIEVTAQRSIMQATQSYALAAPLGAAPVQRKSGGIRTAGLDVQLVWPCKDGYVSVTFLFGASMGPFTRRFMHLIHEEGYCDEATRDKDWLDYTNQLYDGREPVEEYERLKRIVGDFCAARTKAELLEAAQSRMLLLAPVATAAEVMRSPQFEAREYFDVVEDRLLSEVAVLTPGPWVKSSCLAPTRLGRAPRLGEHTEEVLGAPPRMRPPAPVSSDPVRRPPLEGVKVLDLTWAMSGPATTRTMADFGATVVRIETGEHLDVARTVGPFVNDVPGIDASGLLFNMTTGKRSVSLDLREPGARAVLDDLVRWSDVVIESFSPRGRATLDLGYARLSALRPGLIMMSSCLFGQTGPLERYAGLGTMGSALSGFNDLTGWADRPPCGPFGAYTDYPSPRFALCAILAALDHRRRTGQGQYLDFAQSEASVHFLTPALLDQVINGGSPSREGNADVTMAPHGVYRAAGEDAWVAVACRDDRDWRALAGLIGREDLAALSVAARRSRRGQLDEVIEAWTATRPAPEVERQVIAAGVPAHAVQNSGECAADPQLRHLGHYVELSHPEHGTITVEGCRIALSETPGVVEGIPPFLGQDTVEVLTDLLGYDDDRIGALYAAGALN